MNDRCGRRDEQRRSIDLSKRNLALVPVQGRRQLEAAKLRQRIADRTITSIYRFPYNWKLNDRIGIGDVVAHAAEAVESVTDICAAVQFEARHGDVQVLQEVASTLRGVVERQEPVVVAQHVRKGEHRAAARTPDRVLRDRPLRDVEIILPPVRRALDSIFSLDAPVRPRADVDGVRTSNTHMLVGNGGNRIDAENSADGEALILEGAEYQIAVIRPDRIERRCGKRRQPPLLKLVH